MVKLEQSRWRGAALTFAALAAVILFLRWPFAWTGNEENYFLLAHRLVAPESYGPFHPAFDSSRGKWLGLGLFGTTIELFGFETAHRILGILTILVTAAGFAAVARMLRLGVLASLAVLLLFLALGQSIAGGEWFVGGIETKAFAYGFGLLALAAAGSGRIAVSAMLTAVAAYFHFLVGGFWLVCITVFLLADAGRRSAALRFAGIALLILVPLLVALAMDLAAAVRLQQPAGVPSADYIYSVIRAPHHVAPFAEKGGWAFEAVLAVGAGLAIAAAGLALARGRTRPLRQLLITIALLGVFLALAVLLSWIDRGTGALGKFYLFRPASPLLLLILFAAAALLIGRWPRTHWAAAPVAAAALAYLLLTPRSVPWPPRDRTETAPLIAALQANTTPSEWVLVDPKLDRLGGNDIPRKLGRDTVVSWKFVPTNPGDIYRWYQLIKWRKRLFEGSCPAAAGRVGALVVAAENLKAKALCGRVVHHGERASVIDLR